MAALRYLHRAGVVHRDIKPENVLMSERMHVLVADFGSAQILPLDTPAENDQPSHEGSVPTTNTDAETSTAAASSPTKKVNKKIETGIAAIRRFLLSLPSILIKLSRMKKTFRLDCHNLKL